MPKTIIKWLCLCRNLPGSVLTRLSLFPPCRKLQRTERDKHKLKYLTGEWFYETKSNRHRDKIHGTDIIRASMMRRKPVTISERASRHSDSSHSLTLSLVTVNQIYITARLNSLRSSGQREGSVMIWCHWSTKGHYWAWRKGPGALTPRFLLTQSHNHWATTDIRSHILPPLSRKTSWNKASQCNYLNQYLPFQEHNILSSGGERKQVSFFLF